METIKLKFNKDRKVFIPDRDIDLPDNFEVEIEKPLPQKGMKDEEIEKYVQVTREKFVKEFKEKYGIDLSNDSFVKLIGSEAKYSMYTTYKDDKKRIMDSIWEKYHNE